MLNLINNINFIMVSLNTSPHLAVWEEELSPEELRCKKDLEDAALEFFNSKGTKDLAKTLKLYFKNRKTPFTEEEVQTWYKMAKERIQVMHINNQLGDGIFATADIEDDCPIACYAGIFKEPVDDGDTDLEYSWSIEWEKEVRGGQFCCQALVDGTAKAHSNFTRCVNGTTNPADANVDVIWIPVKKRDGTHSIQLLYIASEKIKAGDQLLVYYGDLYRWKGKKKRLTPNTFTLADDGSGSLKVVENIKRKSTKNSESALMDIEDDHKEDFSCKSTPSKSSEESADLRDSSPVEPPSETSSDASNALKKTTHPRRSRKGQISSKSLVPGKNLKRKEALDLFQKTLTDLNVEPDIITQLLTAVKERCAHKTSPVHKKRLEKVIEALKGHPHYLFIKGVIEQYEETMLRYSTSASAALENAVSHPLASRIPTTRFWGHIKTQVFLSRTSALQSQLPEDEMWVKIVLTIQTLAERYYKKELPEHIISKYISFIKNQELADKIAEIALVVIKTDARGLVGKHTAATSGSPLTLPSLPIIAPLPRKPKQRQPMASSPPANVGDFPLHETAAAAASISAASSQGTHSKKRKKPPEVLAGSPLKKPNLSEPDEDMNIQ